MFDLFLVSCLAAGVPAQEPAQLKAQPPLEGNYKVVSILEKTPGTQGAYKFLVNPAGVEVRIAGDELGLVVAEGIFTGTFKTAVDKDHHTIDITWPPVVFFGKVTAKGIYAIHGDTVVVCFANNPEVERPTSLSAGPESTLWILQRVK